jgi:type IV pilus assembly protein PilB
MPLATLSAVIARLKILGGLNIAERRVPQDGRFNITVLQREIDVRISIVATVSGEKAVMRLLDRSNFLMSKEKLGLTDENLKRFNNMLSVPHGIILVAGPTGSGKSTTLYTMLSEVNEVNDNIITIEDPVEYILDGINQMQINPKAGISFATGLRAVLRQDPDVIMIGEIRDAETVEIAIRAAVTGHMVLSTIHTNDAVSTILRLADMGTPLYMIAASVIGVISQRLLRVICPHCKVKCEPTIELMEAVGISPEEAENMDFYVGEGCYECTQTGYKGRTAVHEILVFDSKLRMMIHENRPIDDMRAYVESSGMVSIRDSAMHLLEKGITSLAEIAEIAHGL